MRSTQYFMQVSEQATSVYDASDTWNARYEKFLASRYDLKILLSRLHTEKAE